MRLTSCSFLLASVASVANVGSCAQAEDDPIEVDVAVVGGGASGAYAAVRLQEDYKKSILVIEKANRLVSLNGVRDTRSRRMLTHGRS